MKTCTKCKAYCTPECFGSKKNGSDYKTCKSCRAVFKEKRLTLS